MSKNRQRRRIRSRIATAGLAAPLVEALEARQLLATIAWDGGPSGTGTAWSDPVNWAGDVLPGPNDDALISVAANPTIQITGVVAVRSVASSEALSISGSLTVTDASLFSAAVTLTGTLAGTGDCTFAAPLTWSGGAMAGPATSGGPVGRTIINALGSLQIDGTTHDLNRVLENNGAVTWLAGPLRMAAGTLNNNNTFTANTAGSLQSFGSSGTGVNAFNNVGTFTKLGAGEVAFSVLAAGVAFNSLGTVSLQAGTLTLGGGGTMSTPLTVSPGASFTLGDSYTFTGSGSINGSGTVNFTGGTHSLPAGRFNPTGVVNFTGGTITISTPFTPSALGAIGGNVTFSAVVNYSGAMTITGTASFAVAQSFASLALSGTLTGAGDVTVSGLLDWTGGTMSGSGKTYILASGTLAIQSGAAHVLSRVMNSAGTASWTGGDFAFAAGTFNNNGTFTASTAGTLLSYGNSGANSFVSNGTFTKLGAGEVRFTTNVSGVAFNNVGTVAVNVGLLTLGGGGAASAAFNVGSVGALTFAGNYSFLASGSIAGAGAVSFTGGTQSIPAGLFNPTGVVNFTAGTVTINNAFTPTSLGPIGSTLTLTATLSYAAPITVTGSVSFALPQTFSGLTLSGSLLGVGDVTITGALVWNSGSMTGVGRTLLPAGSTLSISTGATHTLGRQLVSNGSATWSGGAIAMNGGTLTNNGTLAITAATTLQCYGAGGANALNNAGILTKQGVGDALIFAAPSAMPLNNTGSLTVLGGNLSIGGGSTSTGMVAEAGGTITFTANFTYNPGGGVQGVGTFTFNGGTHTFAAGQFSPNGPLNFNGGTVTINNGFGTTLLGPIAGTVILNASVVFSDVTLTGTIAGAGDVTVTGVLNWLGGAMAGTGKTVLPTGATLAISTGAHTLGRRLDSGGAASWVGGDIAFTGGTFNVLAGTTLTISSNAAVQLTGTSGTNVFSNAGSIVKLGIGEARFASGASAVNLNNSGGITVQDGSLWIGGGGTNSGTIAVPLNGSLNLISSYTYAGGSISGVGAITFTGGTHAMTSTSFTPTGIVYFTGGTVTIGNALSPSALGPISGSVVFEAALNYLGAMTVSGSVTFNVDEALGSMSLTGTLAGSGNVTIWGTMTWAGGTMSGAGRLAIANSSNLVINGASHTLSRLLEVSGPGSWAEGDIAFSGGSIAVRPGAVLTLNPAGTIAATGVEDPNTLINQGTINKTGAGLARMAAGTKSVVLTNSGLITVHEGTLDLSGGGSSTGQFQSLGTGTLSFGASMTWTSGSISGAGTVAFTAGTHSILTTQFNPSGPVNFSGGTVTIGNAFTPTTLGPIGATAVFQAAVNFAGDIVIVGSASFALPQNFANMTLSGTLTGAGTITIMTTLTWTGGAMSGAGTTALPAGSITTISGTSHSLGRSLSLWGTADWTAGDLAFAGGTLTVNAGAALKADLASTTSISGGSGVNSFNNSGQFTKLGTGTLQFTAGAPGVAFNNAGATIVQAGTLSIGGGGSTAGQITINSTGALTLAGNYAYTGAGAIVGAGPLSFTGGTHLIGPGQIGVTGQVNFTGGTITVNGSFSPTGLGAIGANVTFLALLNYSGAVVISGSAAFNAQQTFSGMTLTGTLAGSGNVTVTGVLSWTSGMMTGTGQTIIPAGGTLSLTGGARTLGRAVNVAGTAPWSSGDMSFAGGTFAIMDTGVVTVTTGPGITVSGASGVNLFMNKGTLTKQGAGAFTFGNTGTGVMLTNGGTINVQVGSVNVGNFVSNFASGTLTGGTWVIENTGFLNFPAGTNIYTNAATVRMNGVNSSFGAFATLSTNAGSLTLADGRLATFTPLGNLLTNTGQLIKAGTGATSFASTITVSNTGSISVTGGTLSLLGPVSQISGTTLTGGSWNVSGGGVLSIPGASIVSSNAVVSMTGATSAFDAVNGLQSNNGSFTVSGGKSFAAATFTNAGKLTIGAGSSMTVTGAFNNAFYTMIRGGTLNANGGGDSSGAFWFFNGGLLSLSGNHTIGVNAVMGGAGAVNVTGGATSVLCPVNLTGLLTVTTGSISLNQGGAFGSVSNSGTLTLGSRTLTLTGTYTQGPSGTLNVRMDSDTQYGRIIAGGTVALGGTLNVTWGAGYIPVTGISFDFITGIGRVGSFGTTNLASVAGRLFQLSYGPNGVSLLVVPGFGRPLFTGARW